MELEQLGEHALAASVFEEIGEDGQAAALRLEAADEAVALRDRLKVLRDGAYRIDGSTAQGRQLHRTLAKALLIAAAGAPPGAQQRGFLFEAAQALESADEAERAGEVYEELDLLEHAAAAYERAGSIARLEVLLTVLERRRTHEAYARDVAAQIESLLRDGRRALARELLVRMTSEAYRVARTHRDDYDFQRRLAELEAKIPVPARLTLRVTLAEQPPINLVVLHRDTMIIGRAPDAHLRVSGAGLSREHVRISRPADEASAGFVVMDLGSRAGTFLDGAPLDAGHAEAITTPSELSLGMGESMELIPRRAPNGEHLEIREPSRRVLLVTAPVVFHPVDEFPALSMKFEASFAQILGHDVEQFELHGQALATGSSVQLLRGDRLCIRAAGRTATIEVLS